MDHPLVVALGAAVAAADAEQPVAALDALALNSPPDATPLEHGAYGQFARCATELSAMLLAAQAAQAESTPPFPVAAGNH